MDSLDTRKKQIAKILNAPKGDHREVLNLPRGYITGTQCDKAFAHLSIFIREHLFIPEGDEDQSDTEEQLNARSAVQRREYYPGA